MKKLLIAVLCLYPLLLTAQNVGIGTVSPVYRLQVNDPAAGNNYLSITNTTTGTTASDGLLLGLTGNTAILANLESGDLRLGTNNLTRVIINSAGDVGIGTLSPTAKLDINGGVKLEGLNLFEFGAGVAGKEANAGKVGYNAFGTNALAFVGAGTDATNRAVYFFAEGGTTFSGPATIFGHTNLLGQLRLNGSAGSDRQVLTSTGSTDPVWADAAYSNNTRFGVVISKNTGSQSGDANLLSTLYNLNAADVSIGASTITINKTGLYHFDISMITFLNFSVAPAFSPRHELWFYFGPVFALKVIYKVMDQTGTANLNWISNEKVSCQVHITAGSVLHFYHRIGAGASGTVSNYDLEGFITGHLINE